MGKYSISELAVSIDRFPSEVRLNFKKKYEVKSPTGALVTVLMYAVVIAYISRMGTIMVTREDPNVSTYT